MVDQIEEEDILAVYVKDKGMSTQQKREVLVAADTAAKKLPNMRQEQVEALMARLPRDAEGTVSFHELQAVVLNERKKRLKEMKRMFPTVTAAAAGKSTASAIRAPPPKHGRQLGRAVDLDTTKKRTGYDVNKKVSDTEGGKVVASLLAKEVHHIADITGGNNPGLVQNVKLMRSSGPSGWDDTCCLRGSNRRGKHK